MCINSKKFSEYPLKKQLLIVFSLYTIIALFVVGIACIIFITVLGKTAKDSLRDGFLQSAQSDMVNIATNGAQLFDKKLDQLTNNFSNVMTFNAEDAFRTDYPFGAIASHYNWPGQLIGAVYDANYNANVTKLHSTYNVSGKMYNDLSNLSASVKNIVDKTASMDYLFIPTFAANSDFFAGYMATPDGPFLRYYPGALNDNKLMDYINYTPIGDAWYETIIADPKSVTYTAPYYDPIAQRLMITIGRTINNPVTGAFIGAFGSDLILSTIQNDMKNLVYLNKGRTILFEKTSGYVIADSANTITKLITYDKIANPSISSNTWNELLSTHNKLTEAGDYYMLSVDLNTSDNKYMLVSMIDKQSVLNTFDQVIVSVNGIVTRQVIIVSCVFAGVTPIVLLLVLWLVNRVVAPIQKLANASAAMANRIGESSLSEGINADIGHSGIVELDEVAERFKQTAIALGKQHADVEENPYYNNTTNWNIQEFPELSTLIPSAPPADIAMQPIAVPVTYSQNVGTSAAVYIAPPPAYDAPHNVVVPTATGDYVPH